MDYGINLTYEPILLYDGGCGGCDHKKGSCNNTGNKDKKNNCGNKKGGCCGGNKSDRKPPRKIRIGDGTFRNTLQQLI